MPEDELKAVHDEANKRGVPPSALMRQLVNEALSELQLSWLDCKAVTPVVQPAKPARKPKAVVQPLTKHTKLPAAKKTKATKSLSMSERMYQVREAQ